MHFAGALGCALRGRSPRDSFESLLTTVVPVQEHFSSQAPLSYKIRVKRQGMMADNHDRGCSTDKDPLLYMQTRSNEDTICPPHALG